MSPIVSLARMGRLELLPSLYREVLIPAGRRAITSEAMRNNGGWAATKVTPKNPLTRRSVTYSSRTLDLSRAQSRRNCAARAVRVPASRPRLQALAKLAILGPEAGSNDAAVRGH